MKPASCPTPNSEQQPFGELETAVALVSKDEMNVAEFPFALLSHRRPNSLKTLEFSQEIQGPDGRPIRQEWIVTGSDKFGLPLATDDDIYVLAMYFLKRSAFKQRRVYFSRYEALQILGWGDSTRSYRRFEQALDRMVGVTIYSKNAFWDNRAKCYVNKSFGIFDDYELYKKKTRSKGRPGKPGSEFSSISFSEFFFQSIQAGFIKNLDLDFYFNLETPVSKRLYRYLDKKKYQGNIHRTDLMRLASKLPVLDNAYPADVRGKLKRAHEELIRKNYLNQVDYKQQGRIWLVVYSFVPAGKLSLTTRKQEAPFLPAPSVAPVQQTLIPSAVQELVSRGITQTIVEQIVLEHEESQIRHQIEIFDYLVEKHSSRIAKNPAGFLRRSIEQNYAAPKTFIPKAERERQAREEAERLQSKNDAEAKAARTREDRATRLTNEWNSLSADKQAALREQALATLNDFARRRVQAEERDGRRAAGHATLEAEIHKLLETDQSATGKL